jgi:hypothetical protein
VLFAITPEIAKYLSKDQQPFYTATRASLLPFPEPLVAVLVAVFARCVPACVRALHLQWIASLKSHLIFTHTHTHNTISGETVRFWRFRPEAQILLAELRDEEVRACMRMHIK